MNNISNKKEFEMNSEKNSIVSIFEDFFTLPETVGARY